MSKINNEVQEFYDTLAKLVCEYQNAYNKEEKTLCAEIFKQIYTLSYPYISAFVDKKRYTSDEKDDVMQEIFIRVYQNLPNVKNPQYFYKVIQKICCSVISEIYEKSEQGRVDRFNKKAAEKNVHYSIGYYDMSMPVDHEQNESAVIKESDFADFLQIPENIMESKDMVQYLYESVRGKLTEKQFAALILSTQGEKTHAEIATEINVPASTVQRYCKQALSVLKETVLSIEKKQGITLHKVAAAPFIAGLVYAYARTQEVSAAEISKHYETFQAVTAGSASAAAISGVAKAGTGIAKATAVGSAKGSTVKSAGMVLSKKIAIGAVCAAVGGASVGAVAYYKSRPATLTDNWYMLLYVGDNTESNYEQYQSFDGEWCAKDVHLTDEDLSMYVSTDEGATFKEYKVPLIDGCIVYTKEDTSNTTPVTHITSDEFNKYMDEQKDAIGQNIRVVVWENGAVEVALYKNNIENKSCGNTVDK